MWARPFLVRAGGNPVRAVLADLRASHLRDLLPARAGNQQQLQKRAKRLTEFIARAPEPPDLAVIQHAVACRRGARPLHTRDRVSVDAPRPTRQPIKNLLRAAYIARAEVSDTRNRRRGSPGTPSDRHSASTSKIVVGRDITDRPVCPPVGEAAAYDINLITGVAGSAQVMQRPTLRRRPEFARHVRIETPLHLAQSRNWRVAGSY
jgi:hypothetical protein